MFSRFVRLLRISASSLLASAATKSFAEASAPHPPGSPRAPPAEEAGGFEWVPASRFSAEELDASVTSCFAAFIYLPADAGNGLAPARAARGHAFRLGGAAAVARDASVTHYRQLRATVPRVLLVAHSRGGLEVPGGRRDRGEPLHAAAQREFEEETGAALAPPLAAPDLGPAALASVRRGAQAPRPRWIAFVRVTRDEREFDAAVAACARPSPHAHGYPIEVYGSAGVPVYIEGERGGFPRQLALMAPRMQRMVLALLEHGNVLTAAETRELSAAGDAVWALTRASRDPGDAEWATKSTAAA